MLRLSVLNCTYHPRGLGDFLHFAFAATNYQPRCLSSNAVTMGSGLSITSFGLMFKPIGRDTPQRLSTWARGIERIRMTSTKRAVMFIVRSIEPPRLLSLRPLFTIRCQVVLTGSFTSLRYLNPTQSSNTKRFPIPPSHFYLPHIKAVCSPLHLFLSSSTHSKLPPNNPCILSLLLSSSDILASLPAPALVHSVARSQCTDTRS